ncbi:MAG: cytochrome c oxidase assembly protein [Actinomycetota bacterium]|nr:cytochrome c oxidase assembly protein [Actinomycetota bacterium]
MLLQLLPLAVVGVAYWIPYRRRARHLAERGRSISRWRQGCFLAGLLVILGALSPPVDRISDRLFSAHMAQHLLLGDVAALLIVLGLTGPIMQPLLHAPGLGRLRALAHPAVALPLWVVDLYVWHLPVLYEAALRHPVVHVVEHLMFLGFGINMWMALLGPLPKPAWFGTLGRLGYVIGVRLAGAILANVLLWSGQAAYSFYDGRTARYDVSPLQDTNVAGGIMMVEGSIVTICLFAWLFLRSARLADERQELLDLAAARGVELTEERAARAVDAGRGAELRERVERAAT